jgi:hypothetical protein
MNDYLPQLQNLMAFLRTKLVIEDRRQRATLMGMAESLEESYRATLISLVSKAQADEGNIINNILLTKAPTDDLHLQKKDLLRITNASILSLLEFQTDLNYSISSFNKGLNGCGEHATLMFLALMKHFSYSSDVLIESIAVSIPEDVTSNHNFLVINRRGTLENVASWGNCLVIDSWAGIIDIPSKIPKGRAVADLLSNPGCLRIEILFNNQFGLTDLQKYPKGHLLCKLESILLNVLGQYLEDMVNTATTKIDLPWLSQPRPSAQPVYPSISRLSLHSIFNTTNVEEEEKYHNKLLVKIREICGDREEYKTLIEAVNKKDYSLALRKVSAKCDTALMDVILSFKDELSIDVNKASASNSKTALDWIRSANDSIKKEAGIELLMKHGATSFQQQVAFN